MFFRSRGKCAGMVVFFGRSRKKTTIPGCSWETVFPRALALETIHVVSEQYLSHPVAPPDIANL
jgi:hypothetical protein